MFNEYGSIVEVYHDDEDFKGELEFNSGLVFVHVTFKRNTPSAYKKYRKVLKNKKEEMKEMGFPHLYTYTRNPKFVKKIPSTEYVGKFLHKGEEFEVFRW